MKIPDKVICPFCNRENYPTNVRISPISISYTMFCLCGAFQQNILKPNHIINEVEVQVTGSTPKEIEPSKDGFSTLCEIELSLERGKNE